jgi:hypothetical protein
VSSHTSTYARIQDIKDRATTRPRAMSEISREGINSSNKGSMRVIETIGNIEWVRSGTLGGITEQKVHIDWLESSNKNQKVRRTRATRHHKIKRWRVKCAFADEWGCVLTSLLLALTRNRCAPSSVPRVLCHPRCGFLVSFCPGLVARCVRLLCLRA